VIVYEKRYLGTTPDRFVIFIRMQNSSKEIDEVANCLSNSIVIRRKSQ